MPNYKLIVLAGISGVGKSHRYRHDPLLNIWPKVDMKDYYYTYPGLKWPQALTMAVNDIERAFSTLGVEARVFDPVCVVLEGFFMPGSPSRKHLADYCEWIGWQVQFLYLEADEATCRQRILSSGERVEERLFFLDQYRDQLPEEFEK